MSNGWTSKPLGQIVTLQRGFDLPKRLRVDGEVPIISSSGPEDWHNEPIKIGPGLVTGRYGTIGKVFFVDGPYWPLNTTLFVSNFHGNDPRFCYYLLQRFDFAGQSGKTGVPGVNRNDLHAIEVFSPDDPDEQQAIAAALSDADGVVAGLERVIAKKRLIKQGAMQDLLTARRRLPGFSGEWAKVQLKDYTSHGSGNSGLIKGTLQRSGRVGDYPAFTASGPDLMLDFFEQEGDAIIISAVGSRCGKAFRAKGKWSAIANTHVLRCREGLDVDFAFIFMNDEDFWLKGGTGQPFVLVRRTLERPLLLPPVNEQQAIASVLRDMGAEIQNLESRLTKARAVKEGMMQNLLTGRVRLV